MCGECGPHWAAAGGRCNTALLAQGLHPCVVALPVSPATTASGGRCCWQWHLLLHPLGIHWQSWWQRALLAAHLPEKKMPSTAA